MENHSPAIQICQPAQELVENCPGVNGDEIGHGKSHRFAFIWVSSSVSAFSGDNPSKINSDNSVNLLPIERILLKENEPLRNELEEFISCIQTRKNPLTDHQEAVNVQKVMQIIEEKLQRN